MKPIVSSVIGGTFFTAIDTARGVQKFTPQGVLTYTTFIYTYHILQCPMEAIHGRSSLLHNVISAGTLGYLGIASGRIGVPFVPHEFFMAYPQVPPPMVGFLVYGIMAGAFAGFGGKSL